MTIDPELLEHSFKFLPQVSQDNAPNHDNSGNSDVEFPPPGAVLLFDHEVIISETAPSSIATGSTVEVKLRISGDNEFAVLTNSEAVNARFPERVRKRRKLSSNAVDISSLYLTTVESQLYMEAELCTQVRHTNLPLAASKGPYMTVLADRSVAVQFALSALPDASVVSHRHQNLAIKFMAYALQDPSLLNPVQYTASPLDLLRVITKSSSESLIAPEFQVPGLRPTLLAYQRQSVNWALRREGKTIGDDGKVEDLDANIRDYVVSPPLGWRKFPGSELWANPYLMRTSSQDPVPTQSQEEYHGKGLLAEEMGLGKTVEMMSLALLNPRSPSSCGPSETPDAPFRISTTLVIVPQTILLQWVSEIERHAPQMSTLVVKDPYTPIDELAAADIAFVTYSRLSRWLRYTSKDKKRNVRSSRFSFLDHIGAIPQDADSNSESHRSGSKLTTLVEVEFWRVILDEVQMVHTGDSLAALAARRIPRVHAWAVSGTPVKHSLEDMRGIIKFLDLQPFVARPCWQRLIASPIDLEQAMRLVAIRHTRPLVAKQLHIPRQHRKLLLLKFSLIERVRYDRLYDEFLEDAQNSNCNLSRWLLRLRQVCSHTVAQANQSNSAVSKHHSVNNLLKSAGLGSTDVLALTLDQVLGELVDDADSELWSEQSKLMNLQLRLGQLFDKADKMPKALKMWQSTLEFIENEQLTLIDKISNVSRIAAANKSELDQILEKRGLSTIDAELDEEESDSESDELIENESLIEKGPLTPSDEWNYTDAELLDRERNVVITANRVKILKARSRALKELKHRVLFFLGTGYFRLSQRMKIKLEEGELNSPENQQQLKHNMAEESKFYNLAEDVRNDILKEAESKVTELYEDFTPSKLMSVYRQFPTPKSKTIDNITEFYQDIVHSLQGILTEPLMDESVTKKQEDLGAGVQADTDAYSKTLDLQENAFDYLEMLQLLIRDRAAAVNGGNIQASPPVQDEEEGETSLATKLIQRREGMIELLKFDREPLTTSMRVAHVRPKARKDLVHEIKVCQDEYAVLRDLYNARVDYYKQLQDLSDQVADIDIEDSAQVANHILKTEQSLGQTERRIHEKLKMQTYLRHLETTAAHRAHSTHHTNEQGELEENGDIKEEDTKGNSMTGSHTKATPDPCAICLETIVNGALTPCYHLFCVDCLDKWIRSRQKCPLCSHPVLAMDILPVSMIGQGERDITRNNGKSAAELAAASKSGDDSHASDLYLPVTAQVYNQIRRIPLQRMYGVKPDTIVQHVIYIRSQDPTAQIVIFSQWMTMLKVLSSAFTENGVKFATTARTSNGINEFRTNVDVTCLLLHAKADVAGLTLVNANHVFLCEPLMNTAVELQAVSRINRFGQTRETTAWQFCAETTVEQTILGMSTKARLLQTAVDGDMEQADSSTLAKAISRGNLVDRSSGAEIVDNNALRRILFGRTNIDSESATQTPQPP